MKRVLFFVLISALTVSLASCGKKETALEELQEPASIEGLTAPETETVEATATIAPSEPKLETLPPAGSYRPTAIEIQTALQNTGHYTGPIDGKIGPKTREAIKEFQKANGLEVDGKVGPRTWALLGESLHKPAAPKAKKKR